MKIQSKNFIFASLFIGSASLFSMQCGDTENSRLADLISPHLAQAKTWQEADGAQKDLEEVSKFLASSPSKVDIVSYRNSYGAPILNTAAKWGQKPLVEQLLKMGIDPNIRDIFGSSALKDTVFYERYEIASMLIEAGADSEEPLRFAQAFGKNRMIEILTKPVTKPVLVEVPEARKNTEEGRRIPLNNDIYELSAREFLKTITKGGALESVKDLEKFFELRLSSAKSILESTATEDVITDEKYTLDYIYLLIRFFDHLENCSDRRLYYYFALTVNNFAYGVSQQVHCCGDTEIERKMILQGLSSEQYNQHYPSKKTNIIDRRIVIESQKFAEAILTLLRNK